MASRQIVTAEDIRLARIAGHSALPLSSDAIVTQQAREDALKFGIELLAPSSAPLSISSTPDTAGNAGTAAVRTEATAPVSPVHRADKPAVPYPTFEEQVSQMQNSQNASEVRLPFEIKAPAPVAPLAPVVPGVPAAPVVPVVPGVPGVPGVPAQEKTAGGCCRHALDLSSEDLFGAVRREVLAALPPSISPALVDDLIRKALTEQGPGCGGSCLNCARREADKSAPQNGPAWQKAASGVTLVDNRALNFGHTAPGAVGMMEVLSGTDKTLAAGYVEFADTSFVWTFDKPEVLVVLEGQLTILSGSTVLNAAQGDLCALEAGVQVTLEARGKVKYTTIAMA